MRPKVQSRKLKTVNNRNDYFEINLETDVNYQIRSYAFVIKHNFLFPGKYFLQRTYLGWHRKVFNICSL